MKVIAFDAIISSDRVTSFHYNMFKGRQPVARMRLPRPFFGQPLTRPLYLEHDGYRMPQIFLVDRSLILSEEVKRKT